LILAGGSGVVAMCVVLPLTGFPCVSKIVHWQFVASLRQLELFELELEVVTAAKNVLERALPRGISEFESSNGLS
jgi:hypothetical protein